MDDSGGARMHSPATALSSSSSLSPAVKPWPQTRRLLTPTSSAAAASSPCHDGAAIVAGWLSIAAVSAMRRRGRRRCLLLVCFRRGFELRRRFIWGSMCSYANSYSAGEETRLLQ